MTFTRVTQADAPQVQAFLEAHAEHVMFPLNNLVRFGLDGDAPFAPRMWRNADGPITDVLSITKAGMVMPFLPSGHIEAAARTLRGRTMIGIIGEKTASRALQVELGCSETAMDFDPDEAHFNLDLADLVIPSGSTHIAPLDPSTRDIATEWMIDYHISILGMSRDAAAKAVPDRITQEMADDRRVILFDGDRPVATTAFNAVLPDIVQIGGVYTPPEGRGAGHARRALALHLERARANGVTRATLAANAPSAIAAYKSVGFKQIGHATLMLFTTPQVAP